MLRSSSDPLTVDGSTTFLAQHDDLSDGEHIGDDVDDAEESSEAEQQLSCSSSTEDER